MKTIYNKSDFSHICGISNNQDYVVISNRTMIFIYEIKTLKCIFKCRCSYGVQSYFLENDSICVIFSESSYILKINMINFNVTKIENTHNVINSVYITTNYLIFYNNFWKRNVQYSQLIKYNYHTDDLIKEELNENSISTSPHFYTNNIKFTICTPNKLDNKTVIDLEENENNEVLIKKKEPLYINYYSVGKIYESKSGTYKFLYYDNMGKLEIYKNDKLIYKNNDIAIYNKIVLGFKDNYIFYMKGTINKDLRGCLFNLNTLSEEKYIDNFFPNIDDALLLDKKRKIIYAGRPKLPENTSYGIYLIEY